MNDEWTNRRWTEHGAALVLVLLVMLVLSGLGLVALHTTSSSASLSGMHRLQAQSQAFSEAVNQLGVLRGGRQASAYRAATRDLNGEQILSDDPDPTSSVDTEDILRRRGGFLYFYGNAPRVDIVANSEAEQQMLDADGNPGDLFDADDDFVDSVEARYPTDYSYVVRDMVSGPRVPGFGDDFCFVMATIGSDANIGGFDPDDGMDADERARQPQALGRHVTRALLGPIECSG